MPLGISKKVIFVHGYTSSPRKKKYQIIAEDLKKAGIPFSIPQLPGNEYPHSKAWLEIIDKEINSSDLPVILVGHSLGTRAVLLYLDKFKQKIDTVLLIGAFNNNVEENRGRKNNGYADFWDYPVDIVKIKKLANKFVVMHSKDDDAIDYRQGVEISGVLEAELLSYDNMGHFCGEENAERNAQEWLKIIKKYLGKKNE